MAIGTSTAFFLASRPASAPKRAPKVIHGNGKRGRPPKRRLPTILGTMPAAKVRKLLGLPRMRSGRRTRYTPKVQRWFIDEIARRQAFYLRRHGRRLSDKEAIRWSMMKFHVERLVATGLSPGIARQQVQKLKLITATRVNTLQIRLSEFRRLHQS